MNIILRNILGVVAACLVGGLINGLIIQYGPTLIHAPEGVDPMDFESIKANIDKYSFKHWLIPFFAHGLGTFVGALIATLVCATRKKTFALLIAVFFLLGGITAAQMLDWPMPYTVIDLLGAYFPFALLGFGLGKK